MTRIVALTVARSTLLACSLGILGQSEARVLPVSDKHLEGRLNRFMKVDGRRIGKEGYDVVKWAGEQLERLILLTTAYRVHCTWMNLCCSNVTRSEGPCNRRSISFAKFEVRHGHLSPATVSVPKIVKSQTGEPYFPL
jgi:hypothetical protein